MCAEAGWVRATHSCNDSKSATGRNTSRFLGAYVSRLSNESQSLPPPLQSRAYISPFLEVFRERSVVLACHLGHFGSWAKERQAVVRDSCNMRREVSTLFHIGGECEKREVTNR